MGLPDEQKGDREGKQADESESKQSGESETKRKETREVERKELREQLYDALSATDSKEKDYHVRQAIQLLQIEE